jgi:hypothetical protein
MLKWADRCLRNTLQLKFRNNVELARVWAETLKISVNIKNVLQSCFSIDQRIHLPQNKRHVYNN